jgi:hypothetical protein
MLRREVDAMDNDRSRRKARILTAIITRIPVAANNGATYDTPVRLEVQKGIADRVLGSIRFSPVKGPRHP